MSNTEKMISVKRELLERCKQFTLDIKSPIQLRQDLDTVLSQPAEQPQAEPVALPYRLDWTKHHAQQRTLDWCNGWNACLDEIAKLGPLYIRPAQGEPVALPEVLSLDDPRCPRHHLIADGFRSGASWMRDETAKLGPLFTHADPGEVEGAYDEAINASNELGYACMSAADVIRHQAGEAVQLRAELAKCHALLGKCLIAVREQHCDVDEAEFDLPAPLMAEIDAALSSSAEPSAPMSQEDKEQSAFENWIARVCPSGDCDSVHAQWLESSDYADLFDDEAPTAPVERDERAYFEVESLRKNRPVDRLPSGVYLLPATRFAWDGWQARATLERKS